MCNKMVSNITWLCVFRRCGLLIILFVFSDLVLQNNVFLLRCLLNGKLDPSKMLSMTPTELKDYYN